jgi:TnpA family transposase
MPVECTDRDAPFVLDGLLYNETDLDLEEHYRFYPRIRGLQRQRIYRLDPERDYSMLAGLVGLTSRNGI